MITNCDCEYHRAGYHGIVPGPLVLPAQASAILHALRGSDLKLKDTLSQLSTGDLIELAGAAEHLAYHAYSAASHRKPMRIEVIKSE